MMDRENQHSLNHPYEIERILTKFEDMELIIATNHVKHPHQYLFHYDVEGALYSL